jgi:osmoprotectant transport system substrate-binding protein
VVAGVWVRLVAVVAAVGILAAGCSGARDLAPTPSALGDESVTIASFNFSESELLAELYGRALERAGIDVERATRIGPRELVQPALAAGLVEFVPEYAGTALEFLSLGGRHPTANIDATHAALAGVVDGLDVVALSPSPAEDTNAIVVTSATAERYGLETTSDLAPVASTLIFGGPPECPGRPFCLRGLEQVYGLSFESFLPLEPGGSLTRQALDRGDVDVALLFSTDPIIQIDGLVVLEDDLALQPADNVTPLVRREVIDRWGDDFVDRVDEVSSRLTTAELLRLNAEVAVSIDVGRVAERWLDAAGIR